MYSNEEYVLTLLQESAYITQEDADAAMRAAGGDSAIDQLIKEKKVSDSEVSQVIASNSQMEYVDLKTNRPTPEAIEALPSEMGFKYKVAPVRLEGNLLTVAIADPLDFDVLDALPHAIPNYMLETVCAPLTQIDNILLEFYGDDEAVEQYVRKMRGDDETQIGEGPDPESKDEDSDAPIIKLVHEILLEAFKAGASDIHVEPLEKDIRVRYRIDGVLHDSGHHPKKLLASVIARIKILSGSMSIAEKRVPQDGRIQVKLKNKELDLRVSSVPTNHGESIVMRILDKSNLDIGLAQLGFFADDQETFEELVKLPDGIILVTGPTGSGKTTTLYAVLNHINTPDRKIITVEDPVEYQLSGINQVMVKEDIGMTFASALRSMLRQAPNIIMIGEIRDEETANIAINASLTGHLVLSTLHTNDAPSAIARLADIGIKPFLIASSVRAIMAQRLIRKLCECKEPTILDEKQMRGLSLSENQMFDANVRGPAGCDICRGTGYKGRMGIFELFVIDDEARHMVNEKLSTPQLRKRARELGMRTLREDGIRKVLAGATSANEVIRATMSDMD